MNRTYQNISGSIFDKPHKMRDLEINKEYFIKKVFKSKYGYICTTINTDIDLSNEKLKLKHLKDERNNITFYANKPLNDYVKNNNLVQFCLRINSLLNTPRTVWNILSQILM